MLLTLFVTDDEKLLADAGIESISFNTYLQDYPKLNEPKIRVINLCDTSWYLSQGYYCSLLAEARNHQVLPGVKTINDLRKDEGTLFVPISSVSKKTSEKSPDETFVICMGEVLNTHNRKLASIVYHEFMAPLLHIHCSQHSDGYKLVIKRISLSQLTEEQKTFCLKTLKEYAQKSWRSTIGNKKYRWDMAILVNHEEKLPPSNKGAINRFIKAGEKLGIKSTIITANNFNSLNQFDALFIRETTGINHHTYHFSREAENLGIVVIDEADAILRCCNKVFLHDAFSYKKVPSVPSHIISNASEETLQFIENEIHYPVILKMPENSFSKGIFKAENRETLKETIENLLKESALVLAQKYLYTEFDWRIGVLNGRALYACRYYMAKNHWQIYNHGSKRNFSGDFDALPTFEVPTPVLKASLKAANIIGNGLYGIDIKEVNGQAYVLEVNDNPNIDHGVEDAYLGEELYMQIMAEFLKRMETRGS
ncbi:MAG: RimK family protein [Gammaproteobacteria bacterium]